MVLKPLAHQLDDLAALVRASARGEIDTVLNSPAWLELRRLMALLKQMPQSASKTVAYQELTAQVRAQVTVILEEQGGNRR